MLFVYLFTNDLTTPIYVANLSVIAGDVKILWELNGGVRSVEMDLGMDEVSAYLFYKGYLGYRLIILDEFLDIPVADTFITGISIIGTGVHIVCNGAWFRHGDQLYNFDDLAQDTNQGTVTYTVEGANYTLTDTGQDFSAWETTSGDAHYEIWVTNTDNTVTWGFLGAAVSATEIQVYQDVTRITTGWLGTNADRPITSYEIILCYDYKTTSEIIQDALSEAPIMDTVYDEIDDTGTVIGFWEPPIEEGGMYPADAIDKLASMSDATYRQWNYWAQPQTMDMLVPRKPKAYFKAQVNDGAYDWRVYKKSLKGPLSAERNIQELRNDVRVAYNDMDEEENTLKIEPTAGLSDATSKATYWTRETIISAGDSTQEIANKYGNLYLSKYKDSMFANSFTISALDIEDAYGSRWPLWQPIKLGLSYFRFMDLVPDAQSLSESLDRVNVSQAMTMEYSAATNELRVVLDTEDNALDALISRIDAFG